jgi:hypothetical protein
MDLKPSVGRFDGSRSPSRSLLGRPMGGVAARPETVCAKINSASVRVGRTGPAYYLAYSVHVVGAVMWLHSPII